jgi:hypothetical protein
MVVGMALEAVPANTLIEKLRSERARLKGHSSVSRPRS